MRKWLVAGLMLGALALGLVLVLRELPYSSVRLVTVDTSEATRPPTTAFALGPLHWPVSDLAASPALQPFRSAMHASCGDLKGMAAAECAAKVIAERVPVGDPSSEFVRADFDPVAHFERQMAGAPGHCLTRSAILAAELLAVGIPARVVQFLPLEEKGHTLVEVWDDTRGWIVVDPSGGGFLIGTSARSAAADLLAHPASVEWQPFGFAAGGVAERTARKHQFQRLLSGNVLYPEPWLYLRVGQRAAPWPFRGEYARVGPAFLTVGPLQELLFWAIPGLGLLGLALVAMGLRRSVPASGAAWEKALRPDVRRVGGLDFPQS